MALHFGKALLGLARSCSDKPKEFDVFLANAGVYWSRVVGIGDGVP